MSVLAKAGSLLKRFRRAQEGQIALTFALASVPMFMFAGGAIDFVNSSAVHTRLQYALDAAALAAASSKSMPDKQRIRLAQNIFEENWKASKSTENLTAKAKFKMNGDAVEGEASVNMPTALMRIAGFNSFDIESDVSISMSKGKKVEVALVLDYSGSMTWTSGGQIKYVAMKNAAKKLVEDLSKQGPGQVKIGLVPFSQQVRVTLPWQYVVGQTGPGDWTGCTPDRKHRYNITDATPALGIDDSKWGHPLAKGFIPDCAPFAKRDLTVLPLTENFDAINRQLDAMEPFDYTHVALGAEFGWHLLSPNEPFSQGAAYNDKETQKIMIVLSDGVQTVPGNGPSSSSSKTAANENFLSICNGAKKKGIRVMTIAFDMEDEPEAQRRMQSCASDPEKDYYEPETGDDLATAFNEIQTQIASQVFVSE